MKRLLTVLAASTLALILACGDNLKATDAGHGSGTDGSGSGSGFPAAPSLGTQIDRMGRPAVNTALNHEFDPDLTAAGSAKDAYNHDSSPGGWLAAYVPTFMAGLGVIDSLDTGLTCTNGTCTADAGALPGAGCGNQVFYNGMPGGGGSGTATSYQMLAGLLANDQLFVDTTKMVVDSAGTHQNYLGVEFNVATSVPNQTCGGRAPTNDVMDTSYTALATGIGGFNLSSGDFAPAIKDGVGPHADLSNDTFPFLGAPH